MSNQPSRPWFRLATLARASQGPQPQTPAPAPAPAPRPQTLPPAPLPRPALLPTFRPPAPTQPPPAQESAPRAPAPIPSASAPPPPPVTSDARPATPTPTPAPAPSPITTSLPRAPVSAPTSNSVPMASAPRAPVSTPVPSTIPTASAPRAPASVPPAAVASPPSPAARSPPAITRTPPSTSPSSPISQKLPPTSPMPSPPESKIQTSPSSPPSFPAMSRSIPPSPPPPPELSFPSQRVIASMAPTISPPKPSPPSPPKLSIPSLKQVRPPTVPTMPPPKPSSPPKPSNGSPMNARLPTPVASPRAAHPLPETPPQSPKIKPSVAPPSPFSLPPSHLKSEGQHEANFPTEAEKKIVGGQETAGKPKSWFESYGGGFQKAQVGNYVKPKERDFYKKSSDSEDSVVRVITVAGENKGAIMELGYSSRGGSSLNSPNKFKSGVISEGDSSGNKERSKLQARGQNVTAKPAKPVHAYTNSNVQGINSSIIFNSTCSHHDPGVHLSFTRKPLNGHGHGFQLKDNGKEKNSFVKEKGQWFSE